MEIALAALFVLPATMKLGFILASCYFAGAVGTELSHNALKGFSSSLVRASSRYLSVSLAGRLAGFRGLVAYFKFHAPQGFWPLLNDGEGVVLYCFMFLYFASTGGGPWSFDRFLRKRASTV